MAEEQSIEETISAELDAMETEAPTDDISLDVDNDVPPPPEPELEPLTPPHSWPQDTKDLFASWPREGQEQMIRRQLDMEGDYTRTKQQMATEQRDNSNRYNGLEQAIEPHRESLTRRGLTSAQVVSQALSIEKMLNDNPAKGIQWLAQRYGIQQQNQPVTQQPGYQQQQQNPQVAQLQRQVQQQNQMFQQMKQEQASRATAMVDTEIQRFKQEVDDKGNLVRPYINEVEEAMVPFAHALKNSGQNLSNTEIMDQAYQIAIQRDSGIAARVAQENQLKKRAEAAKKVAAAETASSSLNVPTNGVSPSRSSKNSVEDDVKAAMKEHGYK